MKHTEFEALKAALAKNGLKLSPINRDQYAIKDEPKYMIITL